MACMKHDDVVGPRPVAELWRKSEGADSIRGLALIFWISPSLHSPEVAVACAMHLDTGW